MKLRFATLLFAFLLVVVPATTGAYPTTAGSPQSSTEPAIQSDDVLLNLTDDEAVSTPKALKTSEAPRKPLIANSSSPKQRASALDDVQEDATTVQGWAYATLVMAHVLPASWTAAFKQVPARSIPCLVHLGEDMYSNGTMFSADNATTVVGDEKLWAEEEKHERRELELIRERCGEEAYVGLNALQLAANKTFAQMPERVQAIYMKFAPRYHRLLEEETKNSTLSGNVGTDKIWKSEKGRQLIIALLTALKTLSAEDRAQVATFVPPAMGTAIKDPRADLLVELLIRAMSGDRRAVRPLRQLAGAVFHDLFAEIHASIEDYQAKMKEAAENDDDAEGEDTFHFQIFDDEKQQSSSSTKAAAENARHERGAATTKETSFSSSLITARPAPHGFARQTTASA